MSKFRYSTIEDEEVIRLFVDCGLHLHSNYDRYYGVYEGDRLLGAAAMCIYDGVESVEFSVAVVPEERRRALATQLIEQVINYAKQSAIEYEWESAQVEAYVINDKLIALLQRFGFAPHPEEPKRWTMKIS
jgi:GNAT superfamily N-acetyltransferase